MNFIDNLRLRFTYGCLLSQNMMGWYARSLLITSIEIVNKWRNQFHSRDGVRLSMAIVTDQPKDEPTREKLVVGRVGDLVTDGLGECGQFHVRFPIVAYADPKVKRFCAMLCTVFCTYRLLRLVGPEAPATPRIPPGHDPVVHQSNQHVSDAYDNHVLC